MTFISFLRQARQPMRTPDRLLNVYFACRTPAPRRAPTVISGLWRASARLRHAIRTRRPSI
ncbi:hypothetical protein FHW69_003165 [Luteibacter sp. Sphag1AF]|uniref:hypothetical protein n=1 Tax=Luteibacter sp. Sphag1AF TaxID=2587031 RepID=UPI00161AB1AE|nr:hypothetical protein [Luteibacter sp. Sphag1AF]MBB3228523.1 hypothetical protein [Luteibacter sp. Sphag1AF]